jgi:hypothetical protein
MRDFHKIIAWKLADNLTVRLYDATKKFPKEELFALTSQLRRAASSVPSISLKEQVEEPLKIFFASLIWPKARLMKFSTLYIWLRA